MKVLRMAFPGVERRPLKIKHTTQFSTQRRNLKALKNRVKPNVL